MKVSLTLSDISERTRACIVALAAFCEKDYSEPPEDDTVFEMLQSIFDAVGRDLPIGNDHKYYGENALMGYCFEGQDDFWLDIAALARGIADGIERRLHESRYGVDEKRETDSR